MKPADTTADVRALLAEEVGAQLAGFVRLPGTALLAYRWPQVKPMPHPPAPSDRRTQP